jgi:2-oxo-4-hydroxy-4-carboxy-5-ureidoimidazoline decarboxylase
VASSGREESGSIQECWLVRSPARVGGGSLSHGYRGGQDLEIMACVTALSQLSVAELNDLPADAAGREFAGCCKAGRWIDALVAARPYESVRALLAASDAAVAALTAADLEEALAGHPRIGDRMAASAGWSRQEQAGVSAADAELAAALADGNAEYERRFGHIYMVCATGKSGEELLAILRGRLGNDRDTEWKIVAAELAKINQLRLRKLLGAQP